MAKREIAVAELRPLPPNAEELRLVLESVPVNQLQFSGGARKQWQESIRWLAWELARRGVLAPAKGVAGAT